MWGDVVRGSNYRKVIMTACITCERTTMIVYSGVDAFALELRPDQIGRICYPCANVQWEINKENAHLDWLEDQAMRGLL